MFVHSYDENSGWDFRPQVLWETNSVVDLLISLKQTYTTDDAKQLSIGWVIELRLFFLKYGFICFPFRSQRKCIFPEEVRLTYYNDEYTFSGCMKECRIKKSLKFCKCVPPFYQPTGTVDLISNQLITGYAIISVFFPDSLTYCEFKDLECLLKYTINITDITGCSQCELGCHNSVYDIEKFSKKYRNYSIHWIISY